MIPLTAPPVAMQLGLTDLLVVAALGLVVIFVVSRSIVVVDAYEKAVRTDGDDVVTVLEPGLHVVRPFGHGTERVDRRAQTLELPVEATTADGVDASVVVDAEMKIVDPEAAATEPPQYRVPGGTDAPNHRIAIVERASELVVEGVERTRWSDLEAEAFADDLRVDLRRALDAYGVELVELSVESIERAPDGEQSTAASDT